jgi:hypothetical protein
MFKWYISWDSFRKEVHKIKLCKGTEVPEMPKRHCTKLTTRVLLHGCRCASAPPQHIHSKLWWQFLMFQHMAISIVDRLQARQLKNCVLIPNRSGRFFSPPKHPHLPWGPSSLSCSRVLSVLSLSAVKPTTHLHLVLRLRMNGVTLSPPHPQTCHHGMHTNNFTFTLTGHCTMVSKTVICIPLHILKKSKYKITTNI